MVTSPGDGEHPWLLHQDRDERNSPANTLVAEQNSGQSQYELQDLKKTKVCLWRVWLSTNICSAASLEWPRGKEWDTRHMVLTGTEQEPAAQWQSGHHCHCHRVPKDS